MESYLYVGTFEGYNQLSINVLWANYTISSNDTADIHIGLNVSNPGIYPVSFHTIKIYVNLNGKSYVYAAMTVWNPGTTAPTSFKLINASKRIVHQPTVSDLIAAQSEEQWSWRFSIDTVFDLGFLNYATRSFRVTLEGTINI
ncbi:MAG: hypothetical protein ACTSVM_01090 [Candidatus Ranarchaeia archaeon]